MVKSKVLKQLRKKLEKADRIADPLSVIDKEKSSLALELTPDSSEKEQTAARKLSIQCLPAADLTDDLMKRCLDIFERNMGDLYSNSSWGLDMKEKAEEFRHRKARFMLVFATDENNPDDKELACFAHFRFALDNDEDPKCTVLYVYEIQVEAAYRRKGLGRRLMDMLEAVARQTEMEKVMLTVFKKNKSAMQFYTDSLSYEIDKESPSKFGEPVDYEILSKAVV